MKTNLKRTMGVGALALAMMMNLGAVAMAANGEAPADSIPAAAVMKAASVDGGMTPLTDAMTVDMVAVDAGEGANFLIRFDDETGKAELSEDGGKTWKPAGDIAVMEAVELGKGEENLTVSFTPVEK